MTDTAPALEDGTDLDCELMQRVLEAVPMSQPACWKLLSLLDIRASREIDTACVTLGRRSRLFLNPDFVETHCRTREALAMLVMHELFHIMLGHTRLFSHVSTEQNLAFDALINAQLCLLFPQPAYSALFRELYPDDVLPWALLRPPAGWPGPQTQWKLTGKAACVHRTLYSETSSTLEELFAMLQQHVGAESLHAYPGRLLGNHEDHGDTMDPDLNRAVREIVRRFPINKNPWGSDGAQVQSTEVSVLQARQQAVNVIRRALWSLLKHDKHAWRAPHRGAVPASTVLPYRSQFDRKAEVLASSGNEPLFFQGCMDQVGLAHRRPVHVYVDVSGSMVDELPLIFGALLPFVGDLHPRIHLFSTVVQEIGLTDLKQGRVDSAWGTDIQCVSEHMLKQRIERALLVTDGWVGEIPEAHVTRLRRQQAVVASVISEGGDARFADVLRSRVFWMPSLAQGREA